MAYEINFCETKEQLKHLAEVASGKVDGSPSGADIDESTLSYTGQVRRTLPKLIGQFDQQRAILDAEAEDAINTYRRINAGDYSSGPLLLDDKFTYAKYNGGRFYAVNPPYTTDPTTFPDPSDDTVNLKEISLLDEQTMRSIANQTAEQILDGEIFPQDYDQYLQVGDVIVSASYVRIIDGTDVRIYRTIEPIAGTVTAINTTNSGIATITVSGNDYLCVSGVKTDITKVIDINEDTTIPHDWEIDVKRGGGFNVQPGVTLTINCNVEAGHYRIFFGLGTVTTEYVTSRSEINNLSHVKAAWFGVVSDAQTQATNATPQAGTNTLGDLPTGTDSTLALKKAAEMAQKASFHGGRFLEINSPCPLVLPPHGHIKVTGNNPIGNRLFLTELGVLDASADAGSNFKLLPEYDIIKNAEYDYTIDYNGCTIYWVITGQFDSWIGSSVLINRLVETGKGNILPCGTALVGAGRHIYNKAISQDGAQATNFYNSLSAQEIDVTTGISGLSVGETGTDPVNNPANYAFNYEGYSLGDRLRVRGGTYRGLKGILVSNNPESVEMNFQESDFRCYNDGAIFFNVNASFSQYKLERCGIFMKGPNQTLFRCQAVLDPVGDIVRFSRVAQFVADDCRMEGEDGFSKTIIDANYGHYAINNLVTGLGMVAENDSSRICTLSTYATATFKGGSIPGRASLSLANIDETDPAEINQVRSPMLTLNNVTMYNTHGINKFTFNGKDYGFAILQDVPLGKPVPLVRFINSPNESERDVTQFTGNPMPPCSYYGTFRNPFVIDEFKLSKKEPNGFEYVQNAITIFPAYCVVEDILLDKNPSTATFNRIRLSIGDSDFFFDIASPTERKLNLSLLTRKISVQTSNEAKRQASVVWVDGTDTPIVGSTPPSHLTIKYRAIVSPYEIPAGNISGSAVEIG